MFNFKTLKLDKREDPKSEDPFVGIRRNQETHELEFRLPRGFQDFPDSDFELTKRFFFGMYRTFKKFEQDQKGKKNVINKQDDNKNSPKDNIEKKGDAYQFTDKEDNDVLLYSKISMIDNLLDVYNDLSLDMIERRIGRNEEVDYSKLDQYLDKATYLPNDVIYIDEMDLPRQTFQRDATSLIDLFCFIVSELKSELEQNECIDTHVEDLSKRFKAQYLNHDQSLFNEETFEITLVILKDILNKINQTTVYKDEEYWRLYEAIEIFLYGELDMQNTHEDGIFWGISQFYQVWEDMCNTCSLINPTINVIYADTEVKIKGKNVANNNETGFNIFKKEEFSNPFFIEFRKKRRWMRPDLIIEPKGQKFSDIIKIVSEKDYPLRLNFTPKLIDMSEKNVYQSFIMHLKKSMNKGARYVNNSFKNYSKSMLNQHIEYLEKHYLNKKNNCLYLFDWKYMDLHSFISSKNNIKVKRDIVKQICYEWALNQLNANYIIENQFVIPYFFNTKSDKEQQLFEQVDNEKLDTHMSDNQILLLKANFIMIQQVYLES